MPQHSPNSKYPDSLPAQLYLLAYDPDKGRIRQHQGFDHGIRAAVLADLIQRGALRDHDRKPEVVGDHRTGDPVLDGVLASIADRRSRNWKSWITRDRKGTSRQVRDQLESAGLIKVNSRALLSDQETVTDVAMVEALQKQTIEVVKGSRPVKDIDDRAAALGALAALAEIRTICGRKELRHNRPRIVELASRTGPAGPALEKALAQAKSAAVGAIASGGAAGGGAAG